GESLAPTLNWVEWNSRRKRLGGGAASLELLTDYCAHLILLYFLKIDVAGYFSFNSPKFNITVS
ncbi:MAG: hypothetical protein ACXAAP_11000, partial [Candidatus Thorarchaeota archaeon]